jgi:NodT family efflux transporter outer membrane factor (OMF) lipoprotein
MKTLNLRMGIADMAARERNVIGETVRPLSSISLIILAVGVLFIFASCVSPEKRAAMTSPESFSVSGEAKTPERWWEAFEDEELDRLVEQAMEDNLDVLTAWDRLDQASAIARIAGSPLWPQISGDFSVTDTDLVDGRDPFVVEDTFYGASLIAAYEVDLWGRIRSGRSAAAADFRSSSEDLNTVAISVSSEIAQTWYELLEQREQLGILADQTEVNKTVLGLLELRFNQGFTAAAEVLQQRQQLAATESEVPLVKSRLSVLEHELAVLLGQNPTAAIAAADAALPELPPFPETGFPADLLLRRPDVRAAQLRVEAADYRLSEAIADRFPRLSISISAQDTETKFSSLFDNWLKNLAANITTPIMDGGRRRAEVERTRAVASERLHDFEKTVLRALKEVEDAIVREQRQAEFLASLGEQVAIARQTVEFTSERYLNGATDYLPALTALRTLQILERQELEARRQLITFRIGLYRALAGGWQLEREVSTENKIALKKGDAS